MSIEITEMASMAARFVNSTSSHIFLTGKAGTGKTTFLHELAASTHKSHVILAPTGIAALNAKGVTIHSQFLFPFGSFLVDDNGQQELPQNAPFYTAKSLAYKYPLNARRREVLRNIDLIIIDEVSMLRADLLDAIDARMKSVRRNFNQSFGGVQVLMIGDLYQLPPVVKDHEWRVLRNHYNSPHFFEARSLKQNGFVYIELDKIFRQQNSDFIAILNNLRNNVVTQDDIDTLNQHYQPDAKLDENVITLVTHNKQADALNRDAMAKLKSPSHFFEAEIDGDFPEKLFPLPERIELKVGAQIMFIKNDTREGLYYNGKIAKVVSIEGDDIEVQCEGADDTFILHKEEWENKRYSVDNKSKELEEEVLGTFSQFPVKPAWAITVHKSQGLTFDKAVIDVGRAFAPGQVYVALSRLSSLDGLVLRTPIDTRVVSSDQQVISFSKNRSEEDKLPLLLREKRSLYLNEILQDSFDFGVTLMHIEQIQKKHDVSDFEDEAMRTAVDKLKETFQAEQKNTLRFRHQLGRLLRDDNQELLTERIEKGSSYYETFLLKCLKELLLHMAYVAQFAKTKTYRAALSELDVMLMKKLEKVEKSGYIMSCILEDRDIQQQPDLDKERVEARNRILQVVEQEVLANPMSSSLKTGKKKKKSKRPPKGSTYLDTFQMASEGMSAEEIAEKRGLALTTIESHFSRGIQEGKLSLEKLMDDADVSAIKPYFEKPNNDEISLKDIFVQLDGKYTFGQLRMVKASLEKAQ